MLNPFQNLFQQVYDKIGYKLKCDSNQNSDVIMANMMDILTLDVEVEDLWFNFFTLKADCYCALPNTSIAYSCSCGDTLELFENGEFYCEYLCNSHKDLIEKEEKTMIGKHTSIKGHNCIVKIDNNVALPDNLIFMTNNFGGDQVNNFRIGEETYFPLLAIMKLNKPVLVLFQKESVPINMFHKFITLNFTTFLNIPSPAALELDDMMDEDDVHQNRQSLPRLEGGGRRLMQEYKYICQWCSAEQLSKKTRGRFREIKNYRDHFR